MCVRAQASKQNSTFGVREGYRLKKKNQTNKRREQREEGIHEEGN